MVISKITYPYVYFEEFYTCWKFLEKKRQARGDSSRVWMDEIVATYQDSVSRSPENGVAHIYLGSALQDGRLDEATVVLREAVRRNPNDWKVELNRVRLAQAFEKVGQRHEAYAIYEKEPLKTASALNGFAWLLATDTDDTLRDGKRTVEMATKASNWYGNKDAAAIDTLAAAYAETGDFESAIKWSEKSLELASPTDKNLRSVIARHLESFKKRKAWRE